MTRASPSRELRERGSPVAARPFGAVQLDGFAAIGLADKLNSSAALASSERVAGGFRLRVRDGGSLLAYCERSPASVTLDGRPIEFSHDAPGRRLSVALPHAGDVVITA